MINSTLIGLGGSLAYGATRLYKAYKNPQKIGNQKLKELMGEMEALSAYIGEHPEMALLVHRSKEGFLGSEFLHFSRLKSQIEALPVRKDLLELFLLIQNYVKLSKEYFKHLDKFSENEAGGTTIADRLKKALDASDESAEDLARIDYLKFSLEREGFKAPRKSEESAYALLKDADDDYLLASKLFYAHVHSNPNLSIEMKDMFQALSNGIIEKSKALDKASEEHRTLVNTWIAKQNKSTAILYMEQQASGALDLASQGRLEVLSDRMKTFDRVVKGGFSHLFNAYKKTVAVKLKKLNAELDQIDPSRLAIKRNFKEKVVVFFIRLMNRKTIKSLNARFTSLSAEVAQPIPTEMDEISAWMNESKILQGKFYPMKVEYMGSVKNELGSADLQELNWIEKKG